jgi:uncharacterized protein (TIGR00251 family)
VTTPGPGLQAAGQGCRLVVHVVPQAPRTGADGWHDGALRVRLAAPPVDGKANDALVAWLAAELGLPRRAVRVMRGAASRHKQLAIAADAAVVAAWLARVAPAPPG